MIKSGFNNSLLFFLMLVSYKGIGQNFSVTYSFANVTTTSGRTDPTPVPVATGVSFGNFTAVAPAGNPNALADNPNASGRFSFTGWPLGATNSSNVFSGSINMGQYYEVTLTPQMYYSLQLDSISFTQQRSGTGIRRYSVRSSVDGFGANLPAVIDPPNANLSVIGSDTFQVVDLGTTMAENGSKNILSDLTAYSSITSAVTFRFYAWNAEGSSGTFSIDNVKLSGSTTLSATAPNIIPGTSTPKL